MEPTINKTDKYDFLYSSLSAPGAESHKTVTATITEPQNIVDSKQVIVPYL